MQKTDCVLDPPLHHTELHKVVPARFAVRRWIEGLEQLHDVVDVVFDKVRKFVALLATTRKTEANLLPPLNPSIVGERHA